MAADLTVKQHDTFPALRGLAKDKEKALDLTKADKLKVILKGQSGEKPVIEGIAKALDPNEDPEGMNWEYEWQEGDTDVVMLYDCELEITWKEGTTPPQVQTVPNGAYSTVEIKADLA